jgi:hypothetical protein
MLNAPCFFNKPFFLPKIYIYLPTLTSHGIFELPLDVSGNIDSLFQYNQNIMCKMRKLVLSATLLIALVSHGQTQNSSKEEKIKNLFALMHQDSLIIKTLDGMTSTMVNSMSTMFNDTAYTNHGVSVSQFTQKLMEKSMEKTKETALKLLNGDMVDIYEKYFTIEEIEDFTTFYKSKSGQRMINQMPDITKDIMAVMGAKYKKDFQQTFMKDVEEITNEVTEQINSQKL